MAFRLSDNAHVLFVLTRPSDRLCLLDGVVSALAENDGFVLAVGEAESLPGVTAGLALGEVATRRIATCPVGPGGDTPAWKTICRSIDLGAEALCTRAGEHRVTLLVDLEAVFGACSATSEMMSAVYHLDREHASQGRPVVAYLPVAALRRNLPADFFGVHSAWVFGGAGAGTRSDELDRAAEQIALAVPEFRQRFLASSREGAEAVMPLVPRTLGDFRQGLLLTDRKFVIRYCSRRACELLGRMPEDLQDRYLSNCIDGVDLVTVKHECEKLQPGSASRAPFIASWRLSPGVYEPREVRIDPLRSEHQTIGYIIALSTVEPARGARAVYEQLKEEKAGATTEPREDDNEVLSDEEEVSADLHGTRITRREHEVILLILKGMTNREISEHLSIAEVTVKKHLTGVYRKLRITSRRELLQSFSRPGGAV